MRAVPRHLPLPTPLPATKLLPSAFTSAAAVIHRTTPSAASSSAFAPTAIDLLPVDSPATAFWDYQFLFASQRSESAEPVPLRLVAGSVPADFPAGTYYLAGPGLFTDDHGSTVHPLDGHGYLRSFSFAGDGGTVRYSARFVETQAQREEREEGTGRWRFTHRGPFSVLRGGKRVGNVKVMKNVANTSVLRWGGRLMCMWDGGDPYEIDPRSLDTVGPMDLAGRERLDGDRPAKDRWWEMAGARDVAGLGVDVATHFLKPVVHGECSL